MSITLSGTLTIKSINGSYGAFSVGDLATDIGNFRIKDTILDQYDPGQYTGKFVISTIFPESYTWRGRVSVEVRARLQEIILNDDSVLPPVATTVMEEPDPINEEIIEKAKAGRAGKTEDKITQITDIFNEDLRRQIGLGIVKLDPTVDRDLFRKQRDALKAMGFQFTVSTQQWVK